MVFQWRQCRTRCCQNHSANFLYEQVNWEHPQICINIHPDAVPPIHAESYHVVTDKPPPAKMATSFGLFSATFYNQSQLARSTLLVDQHCGNGCSIKRAPLSVSYYNEISGGHIWRGLYGGGVLPAQYYPVRTPQYFIILCIYIGLLHHVP